MYAFAADGHSYSFRPEPGALTALAGLFRQITVQACLDVFACGIFNWGNKFNITLKMDSTEESEYPPNMEYRQEQIA